MELSRMKELVSELNKASRAYYSEGEEIMPDREYDRLYDELEQLEAQLGITFAGSPTNKVGFEVVSGLTKAAHETPLLSLDKTKSTEKLLEFLGTEEGLLSWKLDGLNISLKYAGGELVQAITRGNGQIGEDITHNAKVLKNVPLKVPHKGSFTVNGEAVITLPDFEEINKKEGGKYKNPRNLVSGAMRLLSSMAAAARPAYFYAIGAALSEHAQSTGNRLVAHENNSDVGATPASPAFTKKSQKLKWLKEQGFGVARFEHVNAINLQESVQMFEGLAPNFEIATDGLVLTFDDINYSAALGATSKFPRDSLAFKWTDEIAETYLVSVEWSTSRTGLINPVAVFEPVEIDGTQVSRASIHNVSILKQLELCPGDRITVYKANMIIPQVDENLSKTETPREVAIPDECPACWGKTVIIGNPETLNCTADDCRAKLTGALVHFVSRDALNIQGLSEQTIEKLVELKLLENYLDLFELHNHEKKITLLEGFGKKSFDNLIKSINAAKKIKLENFIYALGIRHIGLANAKLLCDSFSHDHAKIAEACQQEDYAEALGEIKGFGSAMADSLHEFFSKSENVRLFNQAMGALEIVRPVASEKRALSGLTFVITGDVKNFKNRKELQNYIEAQGGRVSTAVSAKTDYLINNDTKSASSKNNKAISLGVKIISEEDFLNLIK